MESRNIYLVAISWWAWRPTLETRRATACGPGRTGRVSRTCRHLGMIAGRVGPAPVATLSFKTEELKNSIWGSNQLRQILDNLNFYFTNYVTQAHMHNSWILIVLNFCGIPYLTLYL